MSLFNLFKSKKENQPLRLSLHLAMRLQPQHRFEIEDVFEETMNKHYGESWGSLNGGGTELDDNGTPISCDIEFSVNSDFLPQFEQALQAIANAYFFAKGSYYQIYQDEQAPTQQAIGECEGLALVLNGTDLADDVYANHDINQTIESINEKLGEHGRLISWLETQHTHLYFYGLSFEQMKSLILPLIEQDPLCEKAELLQI